MLTPYACAHVRQPFYDAPYPRVSFVDAAGHELWTTPADMLDRAPDNPTQVVLALTEHLPTIAGRCHCGVAFGYRRIEEAVQ